MKLYIIFAAAIFFSCCMLQPSQSPEQETISISLKKWLASEESIPTKAKYKEHLELCFAIQPNEFFASDACLKDLDTDSVSIKSESSHHQVEISFSSPRNKALSKEVSRRYEQANNRCSNLCVTCQQCCIVASVCVCCALYNRQYLQNTLMHVPQKQVMKRD